MIYSPQFEFQILLTFELDILFIYGVYIRFIKQESTFVTIGLRKRMVPGVLELVNAPPHSLAQTPALSGGLTAILHNVM